MSLSKKLRKGLITGIAAATVIFGACTVCNQTLSSEYVDGNYKTLRRPDFFGHTEIKKGYDGCFDVWKVRIPFHMKNYEDSTGPDEKCDGLVDKIGISRLGKTHHLCRKQDYQTHQKEFDEADEYFAESVKRFKEYFGD